MQTDEIFSNPLFSYSTYSNEFETISQSLIKNLEKIKENIHFSYSETIFSLIQFGDYYDHFRPNKIEKNNPYWGTVKIMDKNYFKLLKYLKCNSLFITFSKVQGEEYYIFKGKKIPKHSEIDWDQIIYEFKEISNKIMETIEINSIRAFYIIGDSFPYKYHSYIIKYIQKEFILESENIKFIGNKILINNIEITAKNEYILFQKIYDLKIKTVNKSTNN